MDTINVKIIIIGGGLAGLQCGKTLLTLGEKNFLILEKNSSVIKNNSWKTFKPTIEEFGLQDHIFSDIHQIHFRIVDNDRSQLISDITQEIPCYVLDSQRVYTSFEKDLVGYIKTNTEVVSITREGQRYIIFSNNVKFESDIIVDASGSHSIVDKLLGYDDFEQTAMYSCYAKRYDNCNTKLILNHAFFDFDHQFKLMGAWVYPINETQAEIGIARFTSEKEFDDPHYLEKFDRLLEQYKNLTPYKEVFQNGSYIKTMKGYAPLKPRLLIQRNNIYYIGDTKGAIPWSGYGVENALKSGKEAALSIIHKKKYKYYICPPPKGYSILRILWSLDPIKEFRIAATGISKLSKKELYKFYRGKIDLSFFFHCAKISRSQGINTLNKIPIGLVIRVLFGLRLSDKYLKWPN